MCTCQSISAHVQPKRSSTFRMHSSCRDRSSDGKLGRGLVSRPNTYPDVFVKARPHYYQQSLRSMISTERILAFGFQWRDSVTRLLPPNSRKRALRCFQSFGECAWMASIMLFRIMVLDVHPIIFLHPTTEKEKVLLPPRNNREEIATFTQSSLQVHDTNDQQLWFCDPHFFLVFSQKLRGWVATNIEKKRAHGLTQTLIVQIVCLHWSVSARPGRGSVRVPHLRYLSFSRHFYE